MWDYVKYGANNFLGEVLLDLAYHPLDEEPEWYSLQSHQDSQIYVMFCEVIYFDLLV